MLAALVQLHHSTGGLRESSKQTSLIGIIDGIAFIGQRRC